LRSNYEKNANVTVHFNKKDNMQSLNESKENFVEKNRRFVVTEFVKTCDELVIGPQNVSGKMV
jgi:hypothetical protein